MRLLLAGVFSPVLASGTVAMLMVIVFWLTIAMIVVLRCRLSPLTAEGRPRSAALLWSFRVIKACIVIALIVLMIPAWHGIFTIDEREGPRRHQCYNNLKQIGLAMHKYHEAYGCFPPAYVEDDEGRPMYSWRVLLLPFMEEDEQALHAQFRLDEPWDSPENLRVLNAVGERSHLHCPSDENSPSTETNYVMIVGEESLSQGSNSVELAQIDDGTSNTIMVVEVVDSGIQWTEPRDLKANEITFRINDDQRLGIGSRHPGGANVLLCYGVVTFLAETTEPELVRSLMTIAGGEEVSVP